MEKRPFYWPSVGMLQSVNNQKGFALVLALSMLVILSILSVILMSTGTTELGITGNYQSSNQAFYAVERAVEYATSRNILLNMAVGGSVDLMNAPHKANIDAGHTVASGGGVLTEGMVYDVGPGDLPAELAANYGTDFGANYYRVSATAEGPNNSEVQVESSIVRLFKNDDDTIFRTSGGG